MAEYLATVASIDVTYANLYKMVTGGTLNPEQTYRITDYATSTSQAETSVDSTFFYLIVRASSKSSLYPEAAAEKKTTSYTSDCSKWKVWYDVKNDTNKYAWASSSGKGVIYRLIDEYNNDLPYDFKTIKFIRYQAGTSGSDGSLALIKAADLLNSYQPIPWYGLTSGSTTKTWTTLDDDNYIITSINTSSSMSFFTFTDGTNDISRTGKAHDNVMKPTYDASGKQSLNNNIFVTADWGTANDILEIYNVNLGPYCYENTFRGCYNVRFGGSCARNVLGAVHDVDFGDRCMLNVIGNYSFNIKIGNQGTANMMTANSENMKLGDSNSYNVFSTSYMPMTTGNDCGQNFITKRGSLGNHVLYVNTASSGGTTYSGKDIKVGDNVHRVYITGMNSSTVQIGDGFNAYSSTYQTCNLSTLGINSASSAQTGYIGWDAKNNVPFGASSLGQMPLTATCNYLTVSTAATSQLTASNMLNVGNAMYFGQTELPTSSYGFCMRNFTGSTFTTGPIIGMQANFGSTSAYTRGCYLNSDGLTPLNTTTNLGSSAYRWTSAYTKYSVNVSSDERLKEFKGEIDVDFERLKTIPKQYFVWKDDEDKTVHVGTSAQKLRDVYPELVSGEEDKEYLGVQYELLSVVALKAVDKLYDYCKALEKRIEELEG